MSITIRPATVADLPAMLAIYSPYVTGATVSLEVELPTPEQYAQRFAEISAKYPWLCCEDGRQVVGYTYASPFGVCSGFNWSAETSVYVATGQHSKGVGRALNRALSALMAAQGYRTLYARIVVPNEESENFHKKCGFEQAAALPNVGCKFGRWQTVAYYAKPLLPYTENPQPPVPFTQLPATMAKAVCAEAENL
jgi:phosphinothricin acetyltransferase